jgi:hypothetical protein
MLIFGYPFPISIVEKLDDPIAVKGWAAEGLNLADGRTVQLAGFTALPEKSELLSLATKRGVEIADDGTVTGLISIFHKCGNDPVKKHIARVDLSEMLMYTEQGEYVDNRVMPQYITPVDYRKQCLFDGWSNTAHYGLERFSNQRGTVAVPESVSNPGAIRTADNEG